MSKPKQFKWARKNIDGTYDRRRTTADRVTTWGITHLFKLIFKLILLPFTAIKYFFIVPTKFAIMVLIKIISFPINYFKNRNNNK